MYGGIGSHRAAAAWWTLHLDRRIRSKGSVITRIVPLEIVQRQAHTRVRTGFGKGRGSAAAMQCVLQAPLVARILDHKPFEVVISVVFQRA